jgi:DNA polymerase III delta prime subunit
MKRLLLIQNDAPGTGKSTLTRCLARYLQTHGANHQVITLVSEKDPLADDFTVEADALSGASFLERLDQSNISIVEVETGLSDFFSNFYQRNEFEHVLAEAGIQLSVVLPVTGEPDTFEAVIRAAETYSDAAEYTIAHLVTGSYDDDSSAWDRSYAARVMDMFEAVELYIPEIGFQLEMELRAHHLELPEALAEPDAAEIFGRDFNLWLTRSNSQVESARQYLFGDAFIPTASPATARPRQRAARRKASF